MGKPTTFRASNMSRAFFCFLLFSAACVISQGAPNSVTSKGHPSSYFYYRSGNYDTQVETKTAPICQDRCDVSKLCSNQQTCAELTTKYSCSGYYAPGKAYAGWCDSTCGFCKASDTHDASTK